MSSSSFFKLPMISDSAVPDVGFDLAGIVTCLLLLFCDLFMLHSQHYCCISSGVDCHRYH